MFVLSGGIRYTIPALIVVIGDVRAQCLFRFWKSVLLVSDKHHDTEVVVCCIAGV